MPKVWVTRSQPGAERSARTLKSLGYETVVSPLLEIGPPARTPPVLPGGCVLVITSQNALWALAAITDERKWPVMCVGDATADLAKGLGFEKVLSAGGTSRELLALIQENFPKKSASFIHVCGETVRGEITELLQKGGYKAERHIYYAARPSANVKPSLQADIRQVLLYSPKGAEALFWSGIETAHMIAVSISAETDRALGEKAFAERRIARAPNETAMFTMLD